ncbi:DNA-processing protein DprA [Dethiosulfatarculus sandiegensis]|uniref:DNA polymerase n=1 Tax=Dethiosulfatarculus sandiegensis TaxID=1429043 RepID=A0A0D2I045_9BACT|nr:DNA-processing protein DprA [Dethiosulfatarculus sandiegensis]KIX15913.1 DNA polymerase [Dethiosulfatarculus sandiegensis]
MERNKSKAEADLPYWLGLRLIPGVGSTRFIRLIEALGSPREVFQASENELKRVKGLNAKVIRAIREKAWVKDPEQELRRLGGINAKAITLIDPLYPRNLASIPFPPPVLYLRGSLEEVGQGAVAVVGSRRMSPYGRRLARKLGTELSQNRLSVVSGLAKGIDTEAHWGALSAGGHTVAVLGCGLDVPYPRENLELAIEIGQKGAIISEFPLGTPPQAPNFPIRNRIISGLSRAVVVVEAGLKSGSLITARHALDQGREVFAVPGPVGSPGSVGCHHLISQGAGLLQSVADLLEPGAMAYMPEASNQEEKAPDLSGLPAKAAVIMSLLGDDPVHVDILTRESKLNSQEVKALLVHLELNGLVTREPGEYYVVQ